MYYHEFDPAPPLAGHVACYWVVDVDDSVPPGHPHHVLPDGCMALVVVLGANGVRHLVLQGPHTTPKVIPVAPGDRYWGVRFWPDAGGTVLGVSPSEFADKLLPAAQVLGDDVRRLTRSLEGITAPVDAASRFDLFLDPLIAAAPPPDPLVRAAVLAIISANGGAPVGELAAAVGLGPRQFHRRFVAAVGIPPKTYSRIRRLRAALGPLLEPRRVTWSRVAAEFGFTDQAHLVREFTRLARLTPEAVARHVRAIGHGRVRP